MEKLSRLAFHPVKMQSCYEKMDQLKLEGLQQRFDVSSTSVFKQRAQIHMRQVGWGPGSSPVPPGLGTAGWGAQAGPAQEGRSLLSPRGGDGAPLVWRAPSWWAWASRQRCPSATEPSGTSRASSPVLGADPARLEWDVGG